MSEDFVGFFICGTCAMCLGLRCLPWTSKKNPCTLLTSCDEFLLRVIFIRCPQVSPWFNFQYEPNEVYWCKSRNYILNITAFHHLWTTSVGDT